MSSLALPSSVSSGLSRLPSAFAGLLFSGGAAGPFVVIAFMPLVVSVSVFLAAFEAEARPGIVDWKVERPWSRVVKQGASAKVKAVVASDCFDVPGSFSVWFAGRGRRKIVGARWSSERRGMLVARAMCVHEVCGDVCSELLGRKSEGDR